VSVVSRHDGHVHNINLGIKCCKQASFVQRTKFWNTVVQLRYIYTYQSLFHQYLTSGTLQIRDRSPVKKLATGRIIQQQFFPRTVGHSETSFLGPSSDLDLSSGNRVRVYKTSLGFAMRRSRKSVRPNSNI